MSENETVTLTSPYYPSPHPSNDLLCIWTITTSEDFRRPSVTFVDFSLNERVDFVFVKLFNNTVFEATGSVVPESITSGGDNLVIEFDTEYWSLGHRGFKLNLSLNTENGTLIFADQSIQAQVFSRVKKYDYRIDRSTSTICVSTLSFLVLNIRTNCRIQ